MYHKIIQSYGTCGCNYRNFYQIQSSKSCTLVQKYRVNELTWVINKYWSEELLLVKAESCNRCKERLSLEKENIASQA